MSTSAAKSAFHIPSLDGIRALSFLVVFGAHAGFSRVMPGGFGVTVFFFLSGFLITTLLRMEQSTEGTISLRQFYLRRVLRILPPFYLVLALSAAAAALGLLPGCLDPRALAAQALHGANYWVVAHGYEGLPAGTGVYWSLAVEEHFYLIFPCLFLLLRRFVRDPRGQAAALWGLCALVLAWRCALVFGFHSPEDRTYVATDTRFDSILFGCALALWGNPVLDGPSAIAERTWKWLLVPAGAAALLFSFVYRAPAFRETFRYSLQGLALYPLFIAAMRFPTWGPFRLLNTRAVSFVGVLSYSLYLVHHVILEGLSRAPIGSDLARATLALTLSMSLAWGIYELVEKPCARLRKRLASPATSERPRALVAMAPEAAAP